MPNVAGPVLRTLFGFSIILYRLFGQRMRVQGRPLLLLTTTGAKTGNARRALLGWFPDRGDALLVVASNAGSRRHPAWFFNMAKNPDEVWIEIEKRRLRVTPESLKGAERTDAWARVVSLAPGYGAYETKTDRQIPVIRLNPVS